MIRGMGYSASILPGVADDEQFLRRLASFQKSTLFMSSFLKKCRSLGLSLLYLQLDLLLFHHLLRDKGFQELDLCLHQLHLLAHSITGTVILTVHIN